MRKNLTCLIAALGATILASSPAQEPRSQSDFAAMGTAKVLCSAVFVSGRDLDEALRNSGMFLTPDDRQLLMSRGTDRAEAWIELDRDEGTVEVTLHGFTGRAKYFGDQGCVILPPGFDRVFFEPVPVQTTLPSFLSQAWPMGDLPPDNPVPTGLDPETVERAVDAAFAEGSLTAAFVAVYKGQVIGERYGQGANRYTQLESWSMGKSLTASLVGILVQQGHFGLHDPAPVPLWHENPNDPRAEITIAHLLRMSSGLRFSRAGQPPWELGRAIGDHLYIYMGGIDAFHYSITRPPVAPPDTVGIYRNCDPLTLGYLIRRTVEEMGENYLQWPQKALFDRIGVRKQVLEPDPYGNFLLTGYDYGTGRNWARLGLLYLQDGVFEGERILPEGWAEFVSSPAPAWNGEYGGLFWVNGNGRWNVPESAYYMAGAGGQNVIIDPEHELVVARLGHRRGQRAAGRALNNALTLLVEAIEESRTPQPLQQGSR